MGVAGSKTSLDDFGRLSGFLELYYIELPIWEKEGKKNPHPSAFLIKLLGEERGGKLARLAVDV